MKIEKYIEQRKSISSFIQLLSKNSYIIFLIHHVIIDNVIAYLEEYIYSLKGKIGISIICIIITVLCVYVVNKILEFGKWMGKNCGFKIEA